MRAPVVVQEQEQQMVPAPGPSVLGSVEDGLDLLRCQKADHPLGMTFARDGQDPGNVRGQIGTKPVAQVVDKGPNGCEAGVARTDTVATLSFEVLQKAHHLRVLKRKNIFCPEV